MYLQNAIEWALPRLRDEATSRMLDTFEFRRRTGWDYVDGEEVPVHEALFTTPGRVKSVATAQVTTTDAGAREVVTTARELHIPWDSPAVPPDAVAVAIAVDDSSDPTLMGAELHIDGSAPGSQKTAIRLRVKETLT